MNPARSPGLVLLSGTLSHLWIYVVGPVVGEPAGAHELGRGVSLAGTEEGYDDADRAAL